MVHSEICVKQFDHKRYITMGWSRETREKSMDPMVEKRGPSIEDGFMTSKLFGAQPAEGIIEDYPRSDAQTRMLCHNCSNSREWVNKDFESVKSLFRMILIWMTLESTRHSVTDEHTPEWRRTLFEWQNSLVGEKPESLIDFLAKDSSVSESSLLLQPPSPLVCPPTKLEARDTAPCLDVLQSEGSVAQAKQWHTSSITSLETSFAALNLRDPQTNVECELEDISQKVFGSLNHTEQVAADKHRDSLVKKVPEGSDGSNHKGHSGDSISEISDAQIKSSKDNDLSIQGVKRQGNRWSTEANRQEKDDRFYGAIESITHFDSQPPATPKIVIMPTSELIYGSTPSNEADKALVDMIASKPHAQSQSPLLQQRPTSNMYDQEYSADPGPPTSKWSSESTEKFTFSRSSFLLTTPKTKNKMSTTCQPSLPQQDTRKVSRDNNMFIFGSPGPEVPFSIEPSMMKPAIATSTTQRPDAESKFRFSLEPMAQTSKKDAAKSSPTSVDPSERGTLTTGTPTFNPATSLHVKTKDKPVHSLRTLSDSCVGSKVAAHERSTLSDSGTHTSQQPLTGFKKVSWRGKKIIIRLPPSS